MEVESGGADDPTQQTQSTYNYEIGSNYGINVGDVVKITFVQELQSSVPITTVNLSCGGKNGAIVTVQSDTTITNQPTAEYKWVASHVFNGGNYSSTYKNKVWDANTTLELTWTGSYWLVMNNPIVCSYASTSASYNIYASGLIEQWKWGETSSSGNGSIINFLIAFTNTKYSFICSSSNASTNEALFTKDYTVSSVRVFSQNSYGNSFNYYIIGY